MSYDRPPGGQAIFLIFVEEYSSSNDDDAMASAAQDAIALNSFSGLGPFRSAWSRNKQAYLDAT